MYIILKTQKNPSMPGDMISEIQFSTCLSNPIYLEEGQKVDIYELKPSTEALIDKCIIHRQEKMLQSPAEIEQ